MRNEFSLKSSALITGVCALLGSLPAWAQTQSLGSALDIYVFPAQGQDSSQQSQDEATCYDWAVDNSGVDPFEAQKESDTAASESGAQQNQPASAARGSGARGALRGAAAGAVVGEIVDDDAGKGAAWGAAAGGIHSRRQSRSEAEKANQAAAHQSTQAAQEADAQIQEFRKAFSVCLEAKEYMVKF